ncbi:uncharacterized protein LOC126318242 [Schistocerca gregaria]|uniref:uncharacterized protein LOC126318242 n=1 Tax=Schistocerca gregaria TaxID=7010 RepID=UPI00211E1A07|nr:uncharacterized protein LOC126318242 [Schistocerca gregaria]
MGILKETCVHRFLMSIRPPREVGEYRINFDILLGTGSDASVYFATHLPTNLGVAAKVVLASEGTSKFNRVSFEVEALQSFTYHQNLVQIYDVVKTAEFVILFLEYVPNGDLGSFVEQRGRLEESLARQFFCQMLSVLEHCHENQIVHHDFKLENLLLASDYSLRLIDFGLSNRFRDGQLGDFTGSPLYMSPEVFSFQSHDQSVDVWSLGVCLYYMLTDMFPFSADTYNELQEKVVFGEVTFPHKPKLNEDVKELIRFMLRKNPKTRITLWEIRHHPWLLQPDNLNGVHHRDLICPARRPLCPIDSGEQNLPTISF